eukprot:gene9163-6443_t
MRHLMDCFTLHINLITNDLLYPGSITYYFGRTALSFRKFHFCQRSIKATWGERGCFSAHTRQSTLKDVLWRASPQVMELSVLFMVFSFLLFPSATKMESVSKFFKEKLLQPMRELQPLEILLAAVIGFNSAEVMLACTVNFMCAPLQMMMMPVWGRGMATLLNKDTSQFTLSHVKASLAEGVIPLLRACSDIILYGAICWTLAALVIVALVKLIKSNTLPISQARQHYTCIRPLSFLSSPFSFFLINPFFPRGFGAGLQQGRQDGSPSCTECYSWMRRHAFL